MYTEDFLLELIKNKKTRDKVVLQCNYCKADCNKAVKIVKENIKKYRYIFYCDVVCAGKDQGAEKLSKRVTNLVCKYCNTPIKPRSKSNITENTFCNHSCAAKYSNLVRSKPKNILSCLHCSKETGKIIRKHVLLCSLCSAKYSLFLFGERTLQDLSNFYRKDDKRAGSVSHTIATRVRVHARGLEKFRVRDKVCKICGYSTYIEVCHIKPLKDFDMTATLNEINSENNTVCLCPNHHKELDLGLINV